jgi:hypothetical protein
MGCLTGAEELLMDPFVNPGKMGDPTINELKNEFSTIQDRSIESISERVAPRQVATGVMRGTQRIVNTDGAYITLGVLPDGNGDFGIGYYDATGRRQKVDLADRDYLYDTSGNISYASGYLIAGEEPIVIIVKESFDALESISS